MIGVKKRSLTLPESTIINNNTSFNPIDILSNARLYFIDLFSSIPIEPSTTSRPWINLLTNLFPWKSFLYVSTHKKRTQLQAQINVGTLSSKTYHPMERKPS